MPSPKASGEQVKQPCPSPFPLASQLLSRAIICRQAGRGGGEGWVANPDEGWPGAGGWRGAEARAKAGVCHRDCTMWSRALTWLSRTAFLSIAVALASSFSVSFLAAGAWTKLLLACPRHHQKAWHVSQRGQRAEGSVGGGGGEVGGAPA